MFVATCVADDRIAALFFDEAGAALVAFADHGVRQRLLYRVLSVEDGLFSRLGLARGFAGDWGVFLLVAEPAAHSGACRVLASELLLHGDCWVDGQEAAEGALCEAFGAGIFEGFLLLQPQEV